MTINREENIEPSLPVVCIMGPTASGKTDLAIALTQQLPMRIINADSAMVYRGLDIGTAKPNPAILIAAPHRLIDICDPSHAYSAGQYYRGALDEIKAIQAEGGIPLLVGGTMLYFSLLQRGFSDLPIARPFIRQRIQAEAEEKGWAVLHQQLERKDPKSAAAIHPHDAQRIQRALEVCEATGIALSDYQALKRFETLPYRFINIMLVPKHREYLHHRIQKRFDEMLENGFLDEVKALYQREDLSLDLPAIRSVGYRQMWKYLSGEYNWETMRHKAIVATRQLAKRQLTWLRSWTNGVWFNSEDPHVIDFIMNYMKNTFKITL